MSSSLTSAFSSMRVADQHQPALSTDTLARSTERPTAAPEAHGAPAPAVLPGDIPAMAAALTSPHLSVERMCEVTTQFRKVLSIGASLREGARARHPAPPRATLHARGLPSCTPPSRPPPLLLYPQRRTRPLTP